MSVGENPGVLHVREVGRGAGSPCLLLHGFTGSAGAWGDRIPQGLGQGRPVLAVNLPGHGRSPAYADPSRYGIDRVVEDILGVLDVRRIERADWVGYSMGGRVAIAGAVRHPERVRRLVLESTTPGIEDPEDRARRRAEDEALARKLEARGLEWFVPHWMGLPLFRTQRRLPAAVREAEHRRRLENRAPALSAALRGLGTGAQPSFWKSMARVTHPALVLTGEMDARYTGIGARMAAALPRGVHRSIPGVGHAIHLEDPERWLEEVIRFLDPRGDPSGPDLRQG